MKCTGASKILAIHSGALGDLVLFGHLLQRLAGATTLVAGGAKGQLLAGLGLVRKALDFDSVPMHEVFTDTPLQDCYLRERLGQHERLISCFAAGDRTAELRLAGICGALSSVFLPVRPPAGATGHLLEIWSDILGLGAGQPSRIEPWTIPQAWRDRARNEMVRSRVDPARPYAVIHPGAGAEAKRWPLEKFQAVAQKIPQVLFVLGPSEQDRWSDEQIENLTARWPVLKAPELPTLAGVLAGAKVYLGNDSGPSHLAAAVGTQTVGLFGPTNPAHFGPCGPRVRILSAESMEQIEIGQVIEAVV